MRVIFRYIQEYFYDISKPLLGLVSILTAVFIYINYHYDVDEWISGHRSTAFSFLARCLLFGLAFGLPYFFYIIIKKRKIPKPGWFLFMLILAPAIFSFKVALDIPLRFNINENWNIYWNHVISWPLMVIITSTLLFFTWLLQDRDQPFYGIKIRQMNWRPYIIMLLIMLPLVAAASTQPDFQDMYPKMKLIAGVYHAEGMNWWYKLLFELSYGSDFITIELFFRGFLVLAFIKWAGKDAILPMACFYCTIHFGKPLGECISSYFGGMILGIIVYHTRSILGGLMVHLGIAWLMELGGYIGNSFTP